MAIAQGAEPETITANRREFRSRSSDLHAALPEPEALVAEAETGLRRAKADTGAGIWG